MIKGVGLSKKFGEQIIFDNFNFEIGRGEFVCFSGPSGTGKTTLLNIIGLIEPYDSGKLYINGKEYTTNRQKMQYFRNVVGFVFQNFALIENKTVKQNLELIKKRNRTNNSIAEVLNKVGLLDKLDSKVYTLSGGEQQRVALARLFLKQCDIVLADEPTGSLDKKNAEMVMQILSNLNAEGKTIILVSHDDSIKAMFNRVYDI